MRGQARRGRQIVHQPESGVARIDVAVGIIIQPEAVDLLKGQDGLMEVGGALAPHRGRPSRLSFAPAGSSGGICEKRLGFSVEPRSHLLAFTVSLWQYRLTR